MPGSVRIYRNFGSSFAAATTLAGAAYPDALALGDVNNDGRLDLLVTGTAQAFGGDTLYVYLGNGDGTFQAPITTPLNDIFFGAIALGDADGDGKPDLVVGNCCGLTFASYAKGDGSGHFATPSILPLAVSPTLLMLGTSRATAVPACSSAAATARHRRCGCSSTRSRTRFSAMASSGWNEASRHDDYGRVVRESDFSQRRRRTLASARALGEQTRRSGYCSDSPSTETRFRPACLARYKAASAAVTSVRMSSCSEAGTRLAAPILAVIDAQTSELGCGSASASTAWRRRSPVGARRFGIGVLDQQREFFAAIAREYRGIARSAAAQRVRDVGAGSRRRQDARRCRCKP